MKQMDEDNMYQMSRTVYLLLGNGVLVEVYCEWVELIAQ
jgi:hypothetical protein